MYTVCIFIYRHAFRIPIVAWIHGVDPTSDGFPAAVLGQPLDFTLGTPDGVGGAQMDRMGFRPPKMPAIFFLRWVNEGDIELDLFQGLLTVFDLSVFFFLPFLI